MNVSSPFEWLLYIFQPVFSDSCTDLYSIYMGRHVTFIAKPVYALEKNLFFLEVPIFLITEVSYLLHISNSKKNPGKISLCKMRVNIFWATKKPQNHQFPRQKEVKSRTCEAGKSNRLPPLISATFTTFSWRFLFFWGLRIFCWCRDSYEKAGGFMKNALRNGGFWYEDVPQQKTCKTYTMLDLWEDEDAWKERGVSKKHVPYWAVMLEFRVNGDNYFTPNFCTSSFSEWHHSSTNYLVISSHPPIWKKIWFLQGSPLKFRG